MKSMENTSSNGVLLTAPGSIQLEDGTYIIFYSQTNWPEENLECANSMGCFLIGVDLNGSGLPNRWGYDIFTFQVNKTRIVPRGGREAHGYNLCDPVNSISTAGWQNGSACTYWVLQYGN